MPQGNAHVLPSGLWQMNPNSASIPKLVLKTMGKIAALAFSIYLLAEYKSMAYKYTYKPFIGRSMTLGTGSLLTHEPLSATEIDKLKEAEKLRKLQKL